MSCLSHSHSACSKLCVLMPVLLHKSSFTSWVKYNFIGMQFWNDLIEKAHPAKAMNRLWASPFTPTAKKFADPFPLNGECAWAPKQSTAAVHRHHTIHCLSPYSLRTGPRAATTLNYLSWHHTRTDLRHHENRPHYPDAPFIPQESSGSKPANTRWNYEHCLERTLPGNTVEKPPNNYLPSPTPRGSVPTWTHWAETENLTPKPEGKARSSPVQLRQNGP